MKTVLLLSLLIVCGTPRALHADENATVLRVIDGDTLVVRIGNVVEHVRLIGIDAPELKDRSTGVAQCYSVEAKKELRRLVARSPVSLTWDPHTKNRDAYGRLLRMLTLVEQPNGSANLTLVKNGFARVITRFDFEERGRFTQAQQKAKFRRAGLWGGCATPRHGKYLSGSTGRPLERTSK